MPNLAPTFEYHGPAPHQFTVSVTLYARNQAEAEALGDEAQRLAQVHSCPVKIVLPGGQVFREVQPELIDWCPGCTPDNCPGGCNR